MDHVEQDVHLMTKLVSDRFPGDHELNDLAYQLTQAVMGRPAPHPTQTGRHGRPVLSARFVEFLMGLDDGFVSSLDIPQTAQLGALGDGVVPQQAVCAVRLLLADLAAASDLDLERGWAA